MSDSASLAAKLHQDSLIIDALSGHIVAPEPPEIDGEPYLNRVLRAGVNVAVMTISAHADDFETALRQMFHHYNLLQVASDRVLHVKRIEDIERARKERKLGIVFAFQSPTPVEGKFHRWTILQQLGLRQCQLAYNEASELADGCFEPANRGLSWRGIQAVQEMNRLGIVVDLSHAGERSTLEAIEYSSKPCIFSHSNPKALTPSKRNITDEQIRAVAEGGGVVGLSPHGFMVHSEVGVQGTLSQYLDHFEHVAELVGVDHVGVGSDVYESYTKFSWETSTKLLYKSPWTFETVWNAGFNKIGQFPDVTAGLLERGFSEEDVRKILGLNWLRVYQEVWRNDL